jgi:hypothetical protein
VPSEADKYLQYARECAKQALDAETPEERDQLLDLSRVWTEAALREQLNARNANGRGKVVAGHTVSGVRHGANYKIHPS